MVWRIFIIEATVNDVIPVTIGNSSKNNNKLYEREADKTAKKGHQSVIVELPLSPVEFCRREGKVITFYLVESLILRISN